MDAKILCVEHDAAVLESRCVVLKTSGYDSTSASPRMAAAALSSHKFDLLVLSSLSDSEVNRLVNLADGASVLILKEFIMPAELLSLVAQRLNRPRRE